MITVQLFTREGCHLCDDVVEVLKSLQAEYPHKLESIDIEADAALQEQYRSEIPVVVIGPYTLKAPITPEELMVTLAAANDRQSQIEKLGDPREAALNRLSMRWTKADTFTYWFSKHYMAVFNLLVLIYVGLPVLAPVLMKAGMQTPAKLIYRAYGTVCHQLAFRSYFLFGEQAFYARQAAGLGDVLNFNQATGLSEAGTAEALTEARRFVGNEQLGYKIALCERDTSIYGAILLFGIVFSLTGRKLKALPWYLWLIIGLGPIGLDGFSQLLSQPPFNLWAFRESTPFLRSLTGGLFGLMTAWFGYPLVEETMVETRQIMAEKYQRVHEPGAASRKSG